MVIIYTQREEKEKEKRRRVKKWSLQQKKERKKRGRKVSQAVTVVDSLLSSMKSESVEGESEILELCQIVKKAR